MADIKREKYLQTLEYILDSEGKKHYIFAMKLKHKELVGELFSKIDDVFITANLPAPLVDEKGQLVLNDNDEEIINTEPYDAMMELLELALGESRESLESWIDIQQIEDVLYNYRRLSGLKKKLMELQESQQIGTEFSLDL